MTKAQALQAIKKYKRLPYGDVIIRSQHGNMPFDLVLLTYQSAEDAHVIKLLASWRKKHEYWFPSQFHVTIDGTKNWLKNNVLDIEDRMLFMIRCNNIYIGHVGLFRYEYKIKSFELDNIVRGEHAYPGVITHAICALMHWGADKLGIVTYKLQTASDNEKALRLYKRLGFVEQTRVPMIQEKNTQITQWVNAPKGYTKSIKRYNVFMKLFFRKTL